MIVLFAFCFLQYSYITSASFKLLTHNLDLSSAFLQLFFREAPQLFNIQTKAVNKHKKEACSASNYLLFSIGIEKILFILEVTNFLNIPIASWLSMRLITLLDMTANTLDYYSAQVNSDFKM